MQERVTIWDHVYNLPHREFMGAEGLGSGQTADEVAEVTLDTFGENGLEGPTRSVEEVGDCCDHKKGQQPDQGCSRRGGEIDCTTFVL